MKNVPNAKRHRAKLRARRLHAQAMEESDATRRKELMQAARRARTLAKMHQRPKVK